MNRVNTLVTVDGAGGRWFYKPIRNPAPINYLMKL